MISVNELKLIFIITLTIVKRCENAYNDLKFPHGFLIGAASSAYQVEGAWNISGKAENIWDHFVHNYPKKIADESTADVTCDSYHKYKEDIKILKNIGVNHYRFSISWPRVLPKGHVNYVNEKGVQYYHDILDELEKHGIIPFVTIYHWDHPQSLEKLGGWLNEDMAYLYSDYARFIFKEFGHRVKLFTTLNEPTIFCLMGYRSVMFPPAVNLTGSGEYLCLQNMLKGHALAYHIYDKEFRSKHNGQVGIVMECYNMYSKNKSDVRTRDIAFEFDCGWQANPIFSKHGDYPEVMKQRIAERSKLQGYYSSRLPTLSKKWIKFIRGSADFFGLNHYTSFIATPLPLSSMRNWPNDEGLEYSADPKWPSSQSSWLKVVPEGMRDILRTIKRKYGNPPVYITENGVSDGNGRDDTFRINYLHSYMNEMLKAIKRDRCNVKAYTVWSLMDSFEWSAGYTNQFGLVHVNFNAQNRTRTPKKSVRWIKKVLATRKLESPDSY